MIRLSIPGFHADEININHLILDYNGTIAIDGQLLPGVKNTLISLNEKMKVHIVTADTFGLAGDFLKDLPCQLNILDKENQDEAKLNYLLSLGASHCVAIGNGKNDGKMLAAAALGIALIQREGAAFASLAKADIVCSSIYDALNLLSNPKRIIATLRS